MGEGINKSSFSIRFFKFPIIAGFVADVVLNPSLVPSSLLTLAIFHTYTARTNQGQKLSIPRVVTAPPGVKPPTPLALSLIG